METLPEHIVLQKIRASILLAKYILSLKNAWKLQTQYLHEALIPHRIGKSEPIHDKTNEDITLDKDFLNHKLKNQTN